MLFMPSSLWNSVNDPGTVDGEIRSPIPGESGGKCLIPRKRPIDDARSGIILLPLPGGQGQIRLPARRTSSPPFPGRLKM